MQAIKSAPALQGSEEAIMISFRDGDNEAFRLIYDRMVRPLTHFAANIIQSESDAEDIVANAFCKLFHARSCMKSFDHVKRWLYVIVRNESVDYLRHKSRQRESRNDLSYLESGIEELTETERIRTTLLRDVHKEIEKLPRRRKTILRMYFFEEKTTAEIAGILRLNPQTVLNHKTKALDALRRSGLKLKWLREGVPGFAISIAFLFMRLLVAAYLLLIVAGAVFWAIHRPANYPSDTTVKSQSATDAAPGGNRATLTLADGRRINLDSSANGILASQANTRITKMSGGELAYEKSPPPTVALFNTLTTPRAGQFSVTLPDGTRVWLNNASSLRYPVAFTGATREVELSGEAYFEVTKEGGHPFLVHTISGPAGPATIEVLGTTFNIMAYPDEKTERATLINGSIRCVHGSNNTLLKPGQQSVVDRHGDLHTLKDVNTDEITAWKNGFFHFDHADLQTTMRQLARWYDIDIVYEGNIGRQEFVGKIQRDIPLSGVLKGLQNEHLHFSLRGRTLRVLP